MDQPDGAVKRLERIMDVLGDIEAEMNSRTEAARGLRPE